MKPLFDNAVVADDPIYNSIRDDPAPQEQKTKMFVESLWGKFYPYMDDSRRQQIRDQIKNDFSATFWEMYLACTLIDKGYEITSGSTGPDIRVEHKGNIIWIEAITPTSGNKNSSDRVPELVITNPPIAQQVPDEQIILRYRAAIEEKYNNKYFEYLKSEIISKEDFYIIAINGCRVREVVPPPDFEPPRIVRSVLPFGYPQVTLNTVSMQVISEDYQYRARISKASGSSVRTDIFIDPQYKYLSAVLSSNAGVSNRPKPMGDDFIIVLNPLACNPLPDDFLNFGRTFSAKLTKDERTLSSKNWREAT